LCEEKRQVVTANKKADRRALLANCGLLKDLPPDLAQKIAELYVTRRLRDGELLHAKGDEPDGLYGIVSGKVKISSQSASGRQSVLTVLEAGSWFGEISLFDGQPRTHDAHAQGDTVVVMLPQRDFQRLLERHPRLYGHIVRLLCRRIRGCFTLLEDSAFLGLSARLAKRLLHFADTHGEPTAGGTRINLHLPQEELGKMLGKTRESIGKQLKRWQHSGLVDIKYGSIVIRDRARLQDLVEAAETGDARDP
jgi:CRP-like cAMP-binding protein